MKRFVTSLAVFMAGVPLLGSKVAAATADGAELQPVWPLEPVALQPLNRSFDNLFAAHRSHASHRSHRSHYSGAGGGGQPSSTAGTLEPQRVAPAPSAAPVPSPQPRPALSLDEKRMLQIIRVQVALTSLGLYAGRASGELDDPTKESLRQFQQVKQLPASGLMTTDTLNALGVPAVQ